MLSTEQGAIPGPDSYIHTPSAQASVMPLYPVSTGYFRYLPGYCLRRSSYDSFLITYMQRGSCEIETKGRIRHVRPDQIVLLDRHGSYCYCTATGWDAEWLHSSGSDARSHFRAIMNSRNPVTNLHDMHRFEKYLHKTYVSFKGHVSIEETLLNNHIVSIFTELLIGRDMEHSVSVSADIIEDTMTYINEHLAGPLMLEELASQASLSPFYFSRPFKEETGPTPHGCIITACVSNAKSLSESFNAAIREICFGTGFTSEGSFCTTFKKVIGSTPSEYRERIC